jgi:glycerol-3-phosphate dehydrogenase subunit B
MTAGHVADTTGHDAVVIGAGLAGLTAAVRAAEGGARVLVLAKGVGSTHLAPGTIDVLGYDPDRVEHPGAALGSFVAEHPGHPYGLLAVDDVAHAVDWFKAHFGDGAGDGAAGGYAYRGDLGDNVLLATALGVPKPSAVVPETMAGGDLRSGGRPCIVGLRALKDFFAPLLADNLSRAELGIEARAVVLDLRAEERVDSNPLAFARAVGEPSFRATLAREIRGRLGDADRVGLPAVLGLSDPHGAWSDLERRLERPVFEIPTLPPSVPGMRVYRALKGALARAGGRVILNAEVVGAERANGHLTAVRARVAGRENSYPARSFVLATGGFGSGAIALDSRWHARDVVLGLPVANVPGEGEERFRPGYFERQPMRRAGVAADESLRPVDEHGERVADNVLVVGATLAGAEAQFEKSGEGISLATGHRAGELIAEAA